MDINEYHRIQRESRPSLLNQVPRVVCADGFSMIVQASEFHYCSPRENNAAHYTSFEIGFPSAREELLMPYIDLFEDNPTKCVYGRVPTEIINQVIAAHGGIRG